MNGRHLKVDREDWQTQMRASPGAAIGNGHLPGAACRECKHRYRRWILDETFVVPNEVCIRCGIKWPLGQKKWKFGLKGA